MLRAHLTSALAMLLLAHSIALAQTEGHAPVVQGMSGVARVRWERGFDLVARGQLDRAAEQFRLGYAEGKQPEFLYALGQLERQRGDCRAALPFYRAFLQVTRSEGQAAAARVQIDRCEHELQPSSETAEPAPPAVSAAPPPQSASEKAPPGPFAAPVPERSPPAPSDRSRHFYKDWLGGTLCAAGLGALALGSVLYLDAASSVDGSDQSYLKYERSLDARREHNLGVDLWIAGGGLVAAGLVRYWLVSRHDALGVALAPTSLGRGALASWGGSF
jgi:hypothetical protein